MKWLKENWTKVVISTALLIVMGFWYSNYTSKKTIDSLETNIELREDSILVLQTLIKVEKQNSTKHEKRIGELEDSLVLADQQIKDLDSTYKADRPKIFKLPADSSVALLAKNLSKESKIPINLVLNKDSSTTIQQSEVQTVNAVFYDRDMGLKKIESLDKKIQVQSNTIDEQKELINSQGITINLFEKEIEQLKFNITDKDGIIEQKDKQNKRDKIKFAGIGAGIGAGVIIIISLL